MHLMLLLGAGCALGVIGATALTYDVRAFEPLLRAIAFGAVGGCVGGWVWWRIERPHLKIAGDYEDTS